ncbi:MAG TPA: ABC transporter permease [Fimbriimonadaceae bacterium]|nr:ABC transporter permease [Fimbriimonadaceae bacterium]HRJ33915.1 ABC transporter permease [Fimbriimonadaceae bacterium]
MRAELRELWRFRELLWTMIERELRIRYKNSVLGFFWSLLNPLVTVLVMTVVFKYLIGNPTPNFSAYILAAYLPFMFFQFAILDSAQSVLVALPVVKKVYFPREILPLATILSNFVHFLLALGVFFAYLLVIWVLNPGESPFNVTIAFLPGLLIINLALAVGCGLLVSSLNTFYEDIKYVVSVGLYLMFFLCPIMYFSENVRYSKQLGESGDLIYTLYHFNPLAMLSTAYRKVLLDPQQVYVDGQLVEPLPLDWTWVGVSAGVSVLILVGGYALFNRLKWKFVERP